MSRVVRVSIALGTLIALASSASAVRRSMGRVGPSNTWCPIGITDGATGIYSDWNSDPTIPNLGIYEVSFAAPPSGSTTLVLSTEQVGRIDNVFFVPRSELYDPGLSVLDTTVCHKGSDSDFPNVRAPVFTAAAPPFDVHEVFDDDQATLEAAGWTFVNATVGAPGTSATEAVILGDELSISDSCPPSVCSTRAVTLNGSAGDPALVMAPVNGLQPGVVYTLVAWWDFEPNVGVLDVEVVESVIEVPTVHPVGSAVLMFLLLALGILGVRRRLARD